MTLDDAVTLAIDPALLLLPDRMDSPQARRMLLAVGLQESLWQHRHQVKGPAHGYLQFEPIGVQGVLEHPATSEYAHGIARVLDYDAHPESLYAAAEHNDILSCALGRLLLWRLPEALPETEEEGWHQYLSTWRPGRPRKALWKSNWASAARQVEFDPK